MSNNDRDEKEISKDDQSELNWTKSFWGKVKNENEARDQGLHEKSDADITKIAKEHADTKAVEQGKLEKAGLTQAQQRGEGKKSNERKKPSEIRQEKRDQAKDKTKPRGR